MAIHKHLLWLISLCIANLSHAMQPIVLTGNAHTYELPGHIDVLEDEAGNWTIDDIMAPERGSQFLPNANGILRIEGLNTAHWLRFKVQNTSVESRHMILEVRPHSLNYLDVYVSSESGLKRWKAGDALAFHERFVEYRQFIFPLTIASNQTSTVYVRIKSNARTRVSAILVDATEFLLKSHEETLIAGIMYGVLIVMLIYNLLIFLVIREQLYIYYLLFNICCLFFALSVFGYGFQFIWPSSPWVSNYIVPIASYSTLITMILLTQRFLDLRKRSKALNLLLNSMIVLALLGTLLSLFVSVDNALDTLLVMMLIVILVTSFSSFYFWFRGVRIARYLALAWSGFYTCLFIFIALSFDLLPENLWTKYSIHVSILPIILLTSLGLADRINLLRQEKLLEQSKRLQLQQAFSQELEEQVVERTQALELANQALEELSNLDGLTELHNRRSFDNHLARECRRLQRHKIPLSLIMCDIDYFKKFNDTYGHQAGDACLQDVAKSIASSVRRSYDVPARYGGEEFAIILPHLGIDEAYAVAEKIKIAIEQCKIKNEASPIKPFISLSFGVASILPTGNEQDVQRLISMADQALYESKDRGRDQICRFSPV